MAKINYQTSGKQIEFETGTETNLLSTSIRHQCDVPYKCGGGLCGTCKVFIKAGAENLTKIRNQEIKRLGDEIEKGYRLACMTFAVDDVEVSWDNSKIVKIPERIKALWEEKLKS